ncbi:MAG: hypothetical protein R3B90_23230 [Planctomycetaceae bacterium]
MKHVLIIPDGCADEPQPELDGRTPLQAARTPQMDEVATLGLSGQSDNVPLPMPSGSDVGTMSLFGYEPRTFHTGRARSRPLRRESNWAPTTGPFAAISSPSSTA